MANGSAAAGTAAGAGAVISPWAPLGITVFRVLWFAQLGSNIGTWMQTVGAQWFLVESAAGATIIALVQTASLTPSLLFSLPAGVLSDSVDRRRLLIWGSLASAVIASGLTAVTAANALTPVLLLVFTFVLGITAALTGPAWQAIQPELVPREQIAAASGLGGITVNGARAVGPALAGVLLGRHRHGRGLRHQRVELRGRRARAHLVAQSAPERARRPRNPPGPLYAPGCATSPQRT